MARVRRVIFAAFGSVIELLAAALLFGVLGADQPPGFRFAEAILVAAVGAAAIAWGASERGTSWRPQIRARPRSGRTAIRFSGGEGNIIEANEIGAGYDTGIDAEDERDMTTRRNQFR
jgi:hypothetical protein